MVDLSGLTEREQGYLIGALQLLPSEAYTRDGLITNELQAYAQAFARLDAEVQLRLDHILPPLTRTDLGGGEYDDVIACPEEVLADWERRYGLDGTGSYELRNARLLAAIRGRRGIKIVDIQDALFPLLGYRPDLTEGQLFRTDDPESLTDNDLLVEPEEEVYHGYIVIDGALARAEGFTRKDVEKVVDETQAAGIYFEVQFLGFYCDDPYSLTDSDLLAI